MELSKDKNKLFMCLFIACNSLINSFGLHILKAINALKLCICTLLQTVDEIHEYV